MLSINRETRLLKQRPTTAARRDPFAAMKFYSESYNVFIYSRSIRPRHPSCPSPLLPRSRSHNTTLNATGTPRESARSLSRPSRRHTHFALRKTRRRRRRCHVFTRSRPPPVETSRKPTGAAAAACSERGRKRRKISRRDVRRRSFAFLRSGDKIPTGKHPTRPRVVPPAKLYCTRHTTVTGGGDKNITRSNPRRGIAFRYVFPPGVRQGRTAIVIVTRGFRDGKFLSPRQIPFYPQIDCSAE